MDKITCLPLASGAWAYLCAFQDVCTKHVVGWQVRADMPEALVTGALRRALLAQRPSSGPVMHSNCGGQYVGSAYRGPCYATPRPNSRTVAVASATTTPYRVRPRPKACGYASKPRNSKPGNNPFSPTWPMPKPASPTILTITTTGDATPALAITSHVNFIGNILEPVKN